MEDSTLRPLRQSDAPVFPEREKVKARFLDGMARTNIRTAACEAAGISRPTLNHWIAQGIITQDELREAFEKYQDNLRAKIAEMAFIGTPRPLVANGRLVYDIEGKEVKIWQKSEKVLLAMAQRLLPEFRDNIASQVDAGDDIPSEFRVVFDARLLTRDEFVMLKQVAQSVADRKAGIVDAD